MPVPTTSGAPASTTSTSTANVNVNVNGDSGCCNNGWDNDYHPVATAAAVGAAVAVTSAVIGSMVRQRAAKLRAGELRWHGLPAMRRHLVFAMTLSLLPPRAQ